MIRRLLSLSRRRHRALLLVVLPILAALILDSIVHSWRYHVPKPDHDVDQPFFTTCQDPSASAGAPRENAVLVMMSQNSELREANKTITSIERAFNKWFGYPIVFMNDEEWDQNFIDVLNKTAGGKASFEVIPQQQWTFPAWVDPQAAKQSMQEQSDRGVPHAASEGYHHMCRFYSGKFYQLEALKKYKWYWRLEPDVDFTCAITYDPFVQMAKHKKVYGFTIALWEVGTTCPSLFRETADWKESNGIPDNNLWKAMISASWVPWPFRHLMSSLSHRDGHGDAWSMCHYWSNFEIADLDFFRSRRYRQYFEYLDRKRGFYFERWGDAAVHSLAVAMLAGPQKVHHFADFGYRHDLLYQCPANAPGGQLAEDPSTLDHSWNATWSPERAGGVGCRCQCDGRIVRNHPGYCLNKLKQSTQRERPWFTWFL